MKYLFRLLLFCITLFGLPSCTSSPLDEKYTKEKGFLPIMEADPPINKREMSWIMAAKLENDIRGVSNEGKTFRELSEQGLNMVATKKAQAFVDSVNSQEHEKRSRENK